MKAYLVVRGHYSDYRVEAVCLDRDVAQRAVELLDAEEGWSGPAEIDEREIVEGGRLPTTGLIAYRVLMWESGRAFAEAAPIDSEEGYRHVPHVTGDYDEWTVWARDKEHAIKIASERNTMRKALL